MHVAEVQGKPVLREYIPVSLDLERIFMQNRTRARLLIDDPVRLALVENRLGKAAICRLERPDLVGVNWPGDVSLFRRLLGPTLNGLMIFEVAEIP